MTFHKDMTLSDVPVIQGDSGVAAMPIKAVTARKPGDQFRFMGAWLKSPLKTGAVAPSGRFLARMMASYVDPLSDGPVIELGPGTGPVTQALLNRGVRPDRLFLIEYSKDFARLLRQRFPGVTVIEGDAYGIKQTLGNVLAKQKKPVSAIVSSLPLLTRPEIERQRLLLDALALGAERAPFIQFTYGGKPPVPMQGLDDVVVEKSRKILWNMPPARVFVYRKGN
jgi:phosphatidylethanolamine/phosphatidyl-N-methylethanolamine N-methyltransferase